MSTIQTVEGNVRWMLRRDMTEVLAIERQQFEFPWGEGDFVRCLRQRSCIGKVFDRFARNVYIEEPLPPAHERRHEILGYMIYELHCRHYHILNLAVRKDVARSGIGRALVENLHRRHAHHPILAEVRETNLPAQLFFKACGFKAVSLLRDFFPDAGEDAILFESKTVE